MKLERAAERLPNGLHNVPEAALAVGFSSVSHFGRAFFQNVGCGPGLYWLKGGPEQSTANKSQTTGSAAGARCGKLAS